MLTQRTGLQPLLHCSPSRTASPRRVKHLVQAFPSGLVWLQPEEHPAQQSLLRNPFGRWRQVLWLRRCRARLSCLQRWLASEHLRVGNPASIETGDLRRGTASPVPGGSEPLAMPLPLPHTSQSERRHFCCGARRFCAFRPMGGNCGKLPQRAPLGYRRVVLVALQCGWGGAPLCGNCWARAPKVSPPQPEGGGVLFALQSSSGPEFLTTPASSEEGCCQGVDPQALPRDLLGRLGNSTNLSWRGGRGLTPEGLMRGFPRNAWKYVGERIGLGSSGKCLEEFEPQKGRASPEQTKWTGPPRVSTLRPLGAALICFGCSLSDSSGSG